MVGMGKTAHMRTKKSALGSQKGFTIVELMVAATVFSVIMLMVAGTIVRFTNNFQKGVVESSTQTVARNVIDIVSQSLQNGDGSTPQGADTYCVGSTKYTFKRGVLFVPATGNYGLKEEKGVGLGCPSGATPTLTQELLAENMRISDLDIRRVPNTTNLWTVKIVVAYGADDLLESTDPADPGPGSKKPRCKAMKGSQFCAVRALSTTVKQWL